MTLITYPLDDTGYTADDAALFHCTRTTGIHAGDDFSMSVSGADNIINIKPGIAWMRVNRFKGLVSAMKQETDIDMGLPDPAYPRIDRIILQYDANKNDIQLIAKKGSPSSNPLPPERVMSDALYEIHLYEVRREAGAVSITAMNITDLRLDKDCCGLMADSVTEVDTAAINAQINSFLETSQAEFTEWFESIKDLLDENTATKLQNEITALENTVKEHWDNTVPTTRKVNNKALSADISLTAADVSAVPTTRKVNNKALSADISLTPADVSAAPAHGYGTSDLTAGSSSLATGKIYCVYE